MASIEANVNQQRLRQVLEILELSSAMRIPQLDDYTENRSRKGKPRLLLDSNIWRYVVDAEAQGALLHAALHGHYDVQIAPAVVYEALRLRDIPIRNRLIALMTNRRFKRLMPEAYSESIEILEEIHRLRPDWEKSEPDSVFFDRLRKDWTRKTGGFWVRCAQSPAEEASRIQRAEGSLLANAMEQIRYSRKEMMEIGWKSNPPMDQTLAALPRPTPGWNGEYVDAWRVESWAGLTYALSRPGSAYRDWIAPFVQIDDGLLNSPAWVEFWLHQARVDSLPRQWMRWAHAFSQRFRKVTSGSGADNQLFTYFLSTELVVTADKALLKILEECKPYCPRSLPQGRLVEAGRAAVESVLSLISGNK